MTSKMGARKTNQGGGERDPLLLANGSTRINEGAAKRALKTYGVEFAKKATTLELATLLRSTLKAKLVELPEGAKEMTCDDCGESSTEETDFCPYCGSEGEASPVVDVVETDEEAAVVPEVVVESDAKKPAAEPTTKAALAARERDLDARVARIDALKRDFKLNSWDLGFEIKAIYDEQLWKARKHASFNDFVKSDEIEIGRSMAYKLMDVVKNFDRETFLKVGASKLSIVAEIDDSEKRAAALADAKAGASKRTLARTRDTAKGKAPASAKRDDAPPKKSGNEITLLAKVGTKAELYPWRSATSGRPLKVHAEDSFIEVVISEEVRQHIALKFDREGNMVGATVRFVRAE